MLTVLTVALVSRRPLVPGLLAGRLPWVLPDLGDLGKSSQWPLSLSPSLGWARVADMSRMRSARTRSARSLRMRSRSLARVGVMVLLVGDAGCEEGADVEVCLVLDDEVLGDLGTSTGLVGLVALWFELEPSDGPVVESSIMASSRWHALRLELAAWPGGDPGDVGEGSGDGNDGRGFVGAG